MNSIPVDITGHRFERLVVLECVGRDKHANRIWKCKCDCGTFCEFIRGNLVSGKVKSCGCLLKEKLIERNKSPEKRASMTTHGMSRTLTGDSWAMMMQRCFNVKRDDYPRYGGKGIRPCDHIKASPFNLLPLIGDRPNVNLTLDRINNERGYNCGQCQQCIEHGWEMNLRWATVKQQNRNRSNNRYITINGVSKLADEWAAEFGITVSAVRQRYIYRAKKDQKA